MGTTVQENLTYSINPGGTILFTVAVGTLIITFIVFCLRAYVKIGITRKITQDDIWMTAAMILFIPYMTMVALGPSHGGTGRPTAELTPQNIELALWTWAICEVLYPPISFCARTSIACFLHRLAVVRWHKRVIESIMVANLLISLAFWISMLVQCVPLSYFWQRHLGAQGFCIDDRVVPLSTIIHAILGAVLDWTLAFFPIVMLWSVRINRRTKAAVASVLGLGAFCGVFLVLRIPFVRVVAVSPDFLHATTGIATVAIVEPGMGIIAGSLVTLQPLLKRFKLGLACHSSFSSGRARRGLPPYGAHGADHNSRSGGSSGTKYPVQGQQTLSWEERRASISAKNAKNAKKWGYPVPLSTLLNTTKGASEEELRRAETAGSRDGEGTELTGMPRGHRERDGDDEEDVEERRWEVRVSATPPNHRVDAEGDRDPLDSPRSKQLPALPRIAVTRDVKVVSTYVYDPDRQRG